jgi:transposase
MGYVGGESRGQSTLFPVSLDELVGPEHPVRVIDAFVAGLDLGALGFAKAQPAATGRPPYDPGDLLRLYLYGYLNQVRSSRRLERECGRNVELMWLLNRLSPDHKTIAEFRRQNAAAFRAVCRAFVKFCAQAQLIGGQWIAIDGSKFQAVASKRAVVSSAKLEEQLRAIDRQVQSYLETLEQADGVEGEERAADKDAVLEALAQLTQQRANAATTKAVLAELGEAQYVIGEPEAKLMKGGTVAYNVQTAVDAKHSLLVHHEVTNEANDLRSLLPTASAAKQALEVKELNVVADAGYSNGEHAKACEETGITPYVPVQRAVNNKDGGIYFDRSAFVYEQASDSYRCPAGRTLSRRTINTKDRLTHYTSPVCGGCTLKPQCTGAKQRWITRHFEEEALERMQQRLSRYPQVMALRRQIAEHPFANLKYRVLDNGRFLLRGLRGASTEMALAVLAYNFRRALNLLGAARLHQQLITQPA